MDKKQILKIIKTCDIFSKLDDAEIMELTKLVQIIELGSGSILFRHGDLSRDAYIVASGKLLASTITEDKGKIVGHIVAGQIVGEMNLLSKQPRSLTITAKTLTKLLMIPHIDFYSFWQKKPSILEKIFEVAVDRYQDLIGLLEKPNHYKFVGLLPANKNVDLRSFIEIMQQSMPQNSNLLILSNADLENSDLPIQLLNSIADKVDYVVYPAVDKNNNAVMKLTQHAEKILIIGEGTNQDLSPETLEILDSTQMVWHEQPDLVLLYKNSSQSPHNTAYWLQQTDFLRHHHIYLDKSSDFERLIRFINNTATGLVISGGGSKSWAAVGAIKAILETNIPIDAIGGVSSGSVAAACFAITKNYDQLFSDFSYLAKKAIKSISFSKLVLPIISILSANPGTAALGKKFGQQKIEDMLMPYFCTSYNLTTEEEITHKQGLLWEAARASSSIPGIIPPFVINGELHIDGGVCNNLPVDVMRNFLGNKSKIIAISLSPSQSNDSGNYNFPPALSFWESVFVKLHRRNKYKTPHFFNTFFNSLLAGATQKYKDNCIAADIAIVPPIEQYPILNKKDHSSELIDIGYRTAKEALRQQASKFECKCTTPTRYCQKTKKSCNI